VNPSGFARTARFVDINTILISAAKAMEENESNRTKGGPVILDSKQRFSDRVEDYLLYRPGYPAEIGVMLAKEHGLNSSSVVADLGSGTGLLAELFLDCGCKVVGVEPNGAMRDAGDRRLTRFERFRSVEGSAEATGLPDACVDFAVAGQAYHWLNQARTAGEIRRILKPGGQVVLVWNDRRTTTTPFLVGYEEMRRRFALDYKELNHRRMQPEAIRSALGVEELLLYTFDNTQILNKEALAGRVRSSSYGPAPEHPQFEAMMSEVERLFELYSFNGMVTIEYDTLVYVAAMEWE